jgi:hypothetical protein
MQQKYGALRTQDLLLERNALLEHAYAMVAEGSGQGPGGQPRGGRDRDAAGVVHEATAWWLTDEMQVQAAGTLHRSTINDVSSG